MGIYLHPNGGHPDDEFLQERWSDAARAAALAARRAKAKGENWREAGRKAFTRTEDGRRQLVQSHAKANDRYDAAPNTRDAKYKALTRMVHKSRKFAHDQWVKDDVQADMDRRRERKALSRPATSPL